MQYDVIVIGAGLSGLSAAALLAKRGLYTAVLEQGDRPGGSCGSFKRGDVIFDQGAAMLYGFGERGFNAHRFLFNCLEEPFWVVKHALLYVVHFNGKKIRFWPDVDRFIEELSAAFPEERKNIRRFYKRMQKLYTHVISESPSYTTPDETNPREALRGMRKHPLSYLQFLSYLNSSAESLLKKYFTDPEILRFFDKLTSTYCYATVAEAPAILASVMFIDNHEGGSYYPAGSTFWLPGKLEKVIEENGGEMLYESPAERILFREGKPVGVRLAGGEELFARQIIFSGTVWSLYEKLLPKTETTKQERNWAKNQIPTYASVVLYALADGAAIPADTCPVEMLVQNPEAIDESEVTVYIPSLDDHTLCPAGQHTVIAIGPSLRQWDRLDRAHYEKQKEEERERLLSILDRRFPGFSQKLLFCELATPLTIERYTKKDGGAVAGPKQMLGQHMLKRQKVRTRWENLFCCGESTVMGTGTPTVTTSGIAAANAVLKARGMAPFVWKKGMKNYVHVMTPPVEANWRSVFPKREAEVMEMAGKCRCCSVPSCCGREAWDVAGIMRRAACGNFAGAKKAAQKKEKALRQEFWEECERRCVRAQEGERPVEFVKIMSFLLS